MKMVRMMFEEYVRVMQIEQPQKKARKNFNLGKLHGEAFFRAFDEIFGLKQLEVE